MDSIENINIILQVLQTHCDQYRTARENLNEEKKKIKTSTTQMGFLHNATERQKASL